MTPLEFGSPADDAQLFWLAVCGDLGAAFRREEHASLSGGPRGALWLRTPPGCGAAVAAESGLTVVFDGRLDDHDGLGDIATPPPRDSAADDAGVILRGYQAGGDRFIDRLRGEFALLVWDERSGRILVARDRLGKRPLHVAVRGRVLYISPSPNAVLSAGVPNDLNRVAIAEWMLSGSVPITDTFHAQVRRLLPGTVETWEAGVSRARELDHPAAPPAPDGPRDAIAEIDRLLTLSVSRSCTDERLGVFLSGGIDSAVIAAVAADLRRREGMTPPEALSLRFDPPADETAAQQATAEALSLPSQSLRLEDATGGEDILSAALRLAARSWLPPVNPWAVGYEGLAVEAARHGVTRILTGEGGNEVFEPSWEEIAALVLKLRLREARQVAAAWASYGGPAASTTLLSAVARAARGRARRLVRLGGRMPIGRPVARARQRRFEKSLAMWALPDSVLRRDVFSARAARVMQPTTKSLLPSSFDGTSVAGYLEAAHLTRRRVGVDLSSPYYSADLLALRSRIPVETLAIGGSYKAPGLAILDRLLPSDGPIRLLGAPPMDQTLGTILTGGIAGAFSVLGPLPMLAELGIIDPTRAMTAFTSTAREGFDRRLGVEYYGVWQVLACESWLKAHWGR